MNRYQRNQNTILPEDQLKLSQSRVCVVGCGGLGGYVIEMLGRLGVGWITAIDADVFDTTNLNRQLLSHTNNLGSSKAMAAKERMSLVNPEVHLEAIQVFLNKTNARTLLQNHHVIVDAVDRFETRLMLQDIAEELEIVLVSGGIGGWYGQVTTLYPGDRTLCKLFDSDVRSPEVFLGTPSFTPVAISAIQVSEAVKVLLGRGRTLRKQMLVVNLLEQEYTIVEVP